MRQTLMFVLLTACYGVSAPSPEPPASPPRRPAIAEPACTHRDAPSTPLAREELEHEDVPDVATARARLRGVWDGHVYHLDGELGQPGTSPTPGDITVLCFEAGGRVAAPPDDVAERSQLAPECTERLRRYAVRRGEGDTVLLEVHVSGGCPGDAGYEAPYIHPYYVHRLDDRYLVLIDGVTAAVTGFRRR